MAGVTKPATPAAHASGHEAIAVAATVHPGTDNPLAEPTEPRIEIGTTVSDRYKVSRVLGEGGMGVVYAAEHVLMRKEVALKVLHASMCSNSEVVARFEREAIAAAHIDHPNVAAATDFGRLPDGSCFLVLELLKGSSLRDEITKGPIPLPRALAILRGIAAGVSAAHAKTIVHRDLKPENVMIVERDGNPDFVKVLDFGIAKVDAAVGASPGSGKALTRVGTVFGTPEYMAPEQAIGDAVDARADLYALGVIFLEMLTGTCPYSGNALSILRERIVSTELPDMSAVDDAGARALVGRLLAKQPDDRMQTANELIAVIDAMTGVPGRASAMSFVPAVSSLPEPPVAIAKADEANEANAKKRPWVVGAVALGAIAIGALVVVLFSGSNSKAAEPKPHEHPKAAALTAAASVAPAPSPSASAIAEPDPESSASAEATPSPTTSAASARAPHRPAKKTPPPPPKKTGPGGIYIPPPKDWLK